MAGERTFQEACCKHLGIPPAAYEEAVLRECLPPEHRWIGKIRWRFTRSYFQNDIELLRAVADCTSMDELHVELTYQQTNKPNQGLQRGFLRARLSGQRLVNFASQLLPS